MTTRSLSGHPRPAKESHFVIKHGSRHHAYPQKAPYPVSYNREVLELEAIDLSLLKYAQGSVSFIDFGGKPPTTSLDLGCGSGVWVLEAAKEWPECEFTGYDLVNVQISPQFLDSSISQRIHWVHGNFLSSKLPFEDDMFDHVHIHGIARGVPESKWDVLFEEVNRVLRPGGAIEVYEEDVLFPVLPKWFTSPLRARLHRSASVHFPNGSGSVFKTPVSGHNGDPPHDHALLESLYQSVFETRFINLTPTAVLPSYFQTYYRQTTLGPLIPCSIPPLPEPMPAPQTDSSIENDGLDGSDPIPRSSSPLPVAMPIPRSSSISFPSTFLSVSDPPLFTRSNHRPAASLSSIDSLARSYDSAMNMDRFASPARRLGAKIPDGSNSGGLKPFIDRLTSMKERSSAMHLYYSYQSVLACQEAMWEELKDRILNKKAGLKPFGWDDDEELSELQSRTKFELLIRRYKSDMQAWVSLWSSLTNMGWNFPARDPLTKAELVEEERIRESIFQARVDSDAEPQPPCRVMRVLIGYKENLPA